MLAKGKIGTKAARKQLGSNSSQRACALDPNGGAHKISAVKIKTIDENPAY